jgi:hypothetical protein
MAKRRRVGAVLIPVEVSVRSLKREECNTIGAESATLNSDCEHSSPARKRERERERDEKTWRLKWEGWLVASATQNDKKLRRYGVETELGN